MELAAVVVQGARAYPALLPLVLVFLGLTLWACKRRRWVCAAGCGILGCVACVLYVGSPANASIPFDSASLQAVSPAALVSRAPVTAQTGRGAASRGLLEPGRFSSAVRLHPRFPRDFPIPKSFRLESNSGGARSGNLTIRFRFTGETANAACDLREQGRMSGWTVVVLAPHRATFEKDGRIVEAWFSYPAHSVVLDIPDQQ